MYEENIIECTIPSVEDVKDLPREILKASDWWWLRSPGSDSYFAAFVINIGFVNHFGNYVFSNYGVRPLLITNLKPENLKLYDIYKIFDIDWYYIDDGKFLSVNPIGGHRFNDIPYFVDFIMGKISREECFDLCEKSERNNYEKSELKKRVDEWFNELKKKFIEEKEVEYKQELLSCPFCGGEAELVSSIESWVECKSCGATSRFCACDSGAIEEWNKRVN